MRGITRHDQEIGARRFKTQRHLRKRLLHRLALLIGIDLTIRHLRIVIDQHSDVVLVRVSRCQRQDFRHEVYRCIRTHAAQDTDNPCGLAV